MTEPEIETLRKQAVSLRDEAESLRSQMERLWQEAEEIEAMLEAEDLGANTSTSRP